MAQQFFDMDTGLTMNVVNVQASHQENQQQEKENIERLQKLIESGDVIITGGDFNGLGRDLREHDPFVKAIGKGCTFGKTKKGKVKLLFCASHIHFKKTIARIP